MTNVLQEYARKEYTDNDFMFYTGIRTASQIPIVSTDYEEVYAAMKAVYESALDGVEQEDSDREYSFLEGWSATAVCAWRLDGVADCGIGVTSPQRTACIPGLRFLSDPTENPLCILYRQYGK